MAQDTLVKLVSECGRHIIYTRKNKKKLRGVKLVLRKFNPIARKHMVYTEKK